LTQEVFKYKKGKKEKEERKGRRRAAQFYILRLTTVATSIYRLRKEEGEDASDRPLHLVARGGHPASPPKEKENVHFALSSYYGLLPFLDIIRGTGATERRHR